MTISNDTIQSLTDQAHQFRQVRFWEEFKRSIKYHVFVKAPNRIPELLVTLLKTLSPKTAAYLSQLLPQNMTIVPIEKEDPKWSATIRQIQGFQKKINLTESLHFCRSTSHEHCLGTFDNYLILNDLLLACPKEEKEFLIMHELWHLKLFHTDLRIALGLVFAIFDIITLYYFPIGVIFVELAAFYFENGLSCHQEKQADLKAVESLGTNQGALASFEKNMQKFCRIDHLQKFPNALRKELKKIQQIACDFSQISHPSLTQRYLYCKNRG